MKKTKIIDNLMATCKTLFNRLTGYISNPVILQTRKSTPCFQQVATLKKDQYVKHGIPEPPKRPKTAFFKFRDIEYPQVKQDNPELKSKDIIKIVSSKWAEYPKEKKEEMQQESQDAFKMYSETYKNYKSSLTPEQLELLKNERNMKTVKKRNISLKKKREDLEKPKRPASAYNNYFADRYTNMDSSLNFGERNKIAATQWKNEDFEVKNKYMKDYNRKMFEYKDNLKNWEEKMIELGNFDVLGTKSLRKLHKQYKEKAKS